MSITLKLTIQGNVYQTQFEVTIASLLTQVAKPKIVKELIDVIRDLRD